MTGLVGWWPLNEDSGSTAYDLSGNGNHGSLNGGITKGVAGKGGLTAYSLNKSNSEDVSIPHSSGLSLGEVSVFVWIRPRNPDANGVDGLIVKGTNTRNYQLDVDSTQGLAWYDENGGSLHSGVMPQEGEWSHVGAIFQNGTLKLYIDGELVATEEGRPSLSTSSESASIGTDNHGNFFDGDVCDARIYDRLLTPNEVQTLYEWGNGDFVRPLNDSNSSSAVSRWAFDGDATDSWGNNNGSVNGATYVSGGGIRGGAYRFDGNDDWMSISPVFGGLANYSVSAWFKSDSVSRQTLFSERHTNVDDIRLNLQLMEDDTVRSIIRKGSGSLYEARGGVYSANNFYHISATRNGETQKIYLNGVKVGESSAPAGTISQDQDSYIGKQTTSSTPNVDLPFDGNIDDFRIYDKALSPSEVFELYRWGTRGRDLRKLTVNSR